MDAPVLAPIQVDFSRYGGAAAPAQPESQSWREPAPPERPAADQPEPAAAQGLAREQASQEEQAAQDEQAAEEEGQAVAAAAAPGRTLSPEESPLPGLRGAGLTFEEMVERALSEGGGSPFGVQQLAAPLPLRAAGGEPEPREPQATPPRRRRRPLSSEDEEMREFIGLEERLQRGDAMLSEEEQLLCRTPHALPVAAAAEGAELAEAAGSAGGAPAASGGQEEPTRWTDDTPASRRLHEDPTDATALRTDEAAPEDDTRLSEALAWAGLGAPPHDPALDPPGNGTAGNEEPAMYGGGPAPTLGETEGVARSAGAGAAADSFDDASSWQEYDQTAVAAVDSELRREDHMWRQQDQHQPRQQQDQQQDQQQPGRGRTASSVAAQQAGGARGPTTGRSVPVPGRVPGPVPGPVPGVGLTDRMHTAAAVRRVNGSAAGALPPPPTSALVTQMFGSARSEEDTDDAGDRLSDMSQQHRNPDRGQGGLRRGRGTGRPDPDRARKLREDEELLRDQQERFAAEAQRIKRERAAVTQQRVALEQRENAFKQRQEEALQRIEEERQQLEAFTAEEQRKIKRDRRNAERSTVRGAAQAGNEKRLREDLQAQVEALQAAAQAKDARARLQEGRLRSQLDELKKRNSELEGDLAFHEQQRLTRWKAEERGVNGVSSASSVAHGTQPFENANVLRETAADADDDADDDVDDDDAMIDATQTVLKGIDTRLRDSMERSRGLADELVRRSWESDDGDGSYTSRAASAITGLGGIGQQVALTSIGPHGGGGDNTPPPLTNINGTSTKPSKQTSKPTEVADNAAADPDPRVRGRGRREHGNTPLPSQQPDNNKPGRARAAPGAPTPAVPSGPSSSSVAAGLLAGGVAAHAQDAADVEMEWNSLVDSMPTLIPIADMTPRPPPLIFEQHHPDGKHEQEYKGGVRCITFPNGTRKEIRPAPASALEEGHTETVYFSNGDIKQVSGGRTQYFFRSTGTTQITLPEGDNFFSFESGQKERHFADGSRRIVFPNGSIKWI